MQPERIEEIYGDIGSLVVELDSDPASRGAGYLQEIIARTRGYLNKTSVISQEIHKEKHSLERTLAGLQTVLQLRSDELLSNDERVKALPSIDDRRAMLNLILREERHEIAVLEQQIRDLTYIEKAVKARHKELDNTISVIRMQKSLIDSELRTGSYNGDTGMTSRGDVYKGTPGATSEDFSENEISDMLTEALSNWGTDRGVSTTTTQDIVVPQALSKVEGIQEVEEPTEFDKFLKNDEYEDIFDSV